MGIIENIADKMVENQSFKLISFNEARATIEQPFRTKTLSITYDRLSLCIYEHNLTRRQYRELGNSLRKWLESHNSEEKKARIEYGILFHYILLHPELGSAHISKEVRPDFIIEAEGKTIGIEVTRLEKESDNIMTHIISNYVKPGLKANEILAMAFKHHGYKAYEYELLEFDNNVVAIRHIERMLISTFEFVDMIGKKIEKYKTIAQNFDKFIILCNAQHGITITTEKDALNLIEDAIEKFSDHNMNIAILYYSSNRGLQCTEYTSQ